MLWRQRYELRTSVSYLSSHLEQQVILDIAGLLAIEGHLVWGTRMEG